MGAKDQRDSSQRTGYSSNIAEMLKITYETNQFKYMYIQKLLQTSDHCLLNIRHNTYYFCICLHISPLTFICACKLFALSSKFAPGGQKVKSFIKYYLH